MKPILFEFFHIKIYGYGTMIAIGICAAIFMLNYRAKKLGYKEDNILDMCIIAVISGVLGGKILYIITEIKSIFKGSDVLKNIGSGFVIYGAIIGGALGVYYYCRKRNWSVLNMFDIIIPSVALAQGFGRIGCFLAGCCYGKPTTLPIGVAFPNSLFAPSHILRHPTQIYSSMFDFLLAFFLLWYSKKERTNGRVFSLYVIIYSIGRFVVEMLREDPRGAVGIFSTSQFISIFTLIFGIIIYNMNRFKKAKETN